MELKDGREFHGDVMPQSPPSECAISPKGDDVCSLQISCNSKRISASKWKLGTLFGSHDTQVVRCLKDLTFQSLHTLLEPTATPGYFSVAGGSQK